MINLSEIQYLQNTIDASLDDIQYLVDCAVETITEALLIARESASYEATGFITDNEWNTLELTAIYSPNSEIMPHLIIFDNMTYNAEFAVRVLASYLYSIELQQLQERLA